MIYTIEQKITLPQTEEGIKYKEDLIKDLLKNNVYFQLKEGTKSITITLNFTREVKYD